MTFKPKYPFKLKFQSKKTDKNEVSRPKAAEFEILRQISNDFQVQLTSKVENS